MTVSNEIITINNNAELTLNTVLIRDAGDKTQILSLYFDKVVGQFYLLFRLNESSREYLCVKSDICDVINCTTEEHITEEEPNTVSGLLSKGEYGSFLIKESKNTYRILFDIIPSTIEAINLEKTYMTKEFYDIIVDHRKRFIANK